MGRTADFGPTFGSMFLEKNPVNVGKYTIHGCYLGIRWTQPPVFQVGEKTVDGSEILHHLTPGIAIYVRPFVGGPCPSIYNNKRGPLGR